MTDNDATQTRQDDATKQLRAMLDERGVEWRKTPHYSSDSVDNETVFCGEGIEWLAHDHLNGRLGLKTLRYEITPAQAIAATLGADECAIEHNVDGSYKCPICGCVVDYDIRGDDERIITMDDYVIPFNFCPKCGAKVVS